jgi:hypothetical protein
MDKPSTNGATKGLPNGKPKKWTHGGARPGGGKPKGMRWPSTLANAEARELGRQFTTEHLGEFLEAMADNVVGLKHLMMRDPKTGKFERITGDAKRIDKALKTKTAFWIYTKDPNVQAFTDLMNRCIDKPSEHIQIAGAYGGTIQIQWMTRDPEPKPIEGKVIEIEAQDPDKASDE